MAMIRSERAALVARIKRVEGQVRGIAGMVEQDASCVDVLTQIAAATRALQALSLGLVDAHLRHRVADAAVSGATPEELRAGATEMSDAIARLVTS